jgi:hypothetical protein
VGCTGAASFNGDPGIPSSMRILRLAREPGDQRTGIFTGRGEFAGALLEHLGDVLTRMFRPSKEQCDSHRN